MRTQRGAGSVAADGKQILGRKKGMAPKMKMPRWRTNHQYFPSSAPGRTSCSELARRMGVSRNNHVPFFCIIKDKPEVSTGMCCDSHADYADYYRRILSVRGLLGISNLVHICVICIIKSSGNFVCADSSVRKRA